MRVTFYKSRHVLATVTSVVLSRVSRRPVCFNFEQAIIFGKPLGLGYRADDGFAFDGSLVADVMFARDGHRSTGIGPRLEVGTYAFDDLRVGVGPSIQFAWDPSALTCSAHALGRFNEGDFDPGVGARLFLGFRPYNYYSSYGATVGLSLGSDYWLTSQTASVVVAAHLDAMWLSLPVLLLVEALQE